MTSTSPASAPKAVEENAVEIPVAVVLANRSADRHHQRDRGIVLLVRPLFRRIQVAALSTMRKRCGGDGAGFELTIGAAADPAAKPLGW